VNRRQLLTGAVSSGAAAIAGCTALGNDLYEGDAGDYILSHRDIGRVLSEDVGVDSRTLSELGVDTAEVGVESAVIYDVTRGPLNLFGVVVCESIASAETWYEMIASDVEDVGVGSEEINLGDEALHDAAQGFRLVAVRLVNVVIQINGPADFNEVENLAELQIERIEESG